MMRLSPLMAGLLVALIGAGCATKAPYNPFKIAQEEFYGKIKTIALAAVTVPQGLEEPEPVKAKFESLIEARLREAGFSVVPSREVEAIWKRTAEQAGGYFDPATGKQDEEKYKAVRGRALRELKADALFNPSIVVVQARWFEQDASWDGASEQIQSYGQLFWNKLLLLETTFLHGSIEALSLAVSIEDMNGVKLYSNRGGIQVLAKVSGRKFKPVPRDELFANEERNMGAVNIALGSLVTKTAPTETPRAQ